MVTTPPLWSLMIVMATLCCEAIKTQYYYQQPTPLIGYYHGNGYGTTYYYTNGMYQPLYQQYQYPMMTRQINNVPTFRQYDRRPYRQPIGLPQPRQTGGRSLHHTLAPLAARQHNQLQNQNHNRNRNRKRRYLKSKKSRSGRRRKEKSMFAVYSGFQIPGGSVLKGKFGSALGCRRACANLGYCMAADYNRKRQKCYIHTSSTSCDAMATHEASIHFQRAPCESIGSSEAEGASIFPGKYVSGGIESLGVDNLQDCIKHCTHSGGGTDSTCFGIDYNYETQTCYLHGMRSRVCPAPDEDSLLDKPNAIHMVYC